MTKTIRLSSFEKVSKFVKIAEKLPFEIDLQQQRNIIDGKSLVGVMTLNLCNTIEMIMYSDETEELVRFLEDISEFIV
jgi:phosphotransferase system HPr-like phosphotransfer protein